MLKAKQIYKAAMSLKIKGLRTFVTLTVPEGFWDNLNHPETRL